MIKEYVDDSLKYIKRNKKSFLLILIFSFLFLLLFLDIIFIKNFHGYFDYAINKNIGFRTFTVYIEKTPIESINEIKEIKNVTEVYGANYKSFSAKTDLNINNLDGSIDLLYGTQNITPKSLVGKSIEEVKSGEMICPIDFYPDSSIGSLKIDENRIVKPEQSLNQEFKVFYLQSIRKIVDNKVVEEEKELIKKFKIVGLYDSTLVMNFNNQCYITPNDMIELQDSLNPPMDDTHPFSFLHVVVDKEENVEKTMRILQELGYMVDTETNATIDKEVVTTLTILSNTFFVLIIGAILLILRNYLNKKIKSEAKYMGILRACGYNKKQVILRELMGNLTLLLISSIISLFFVSIIFLILEKSLLIFLTYIGFKVTNHKGLLFIFALIVILISIIMQIFIIRKSLEKTISNILKEE